MNAHLQNIFRFIEDNKHFPAEQRDPLLKSLKDVNKQIEISAFKLNRTEKVKRATSILLEETIEELEKKPVKNE